MAALRERVLSSTLYPNYLISADGRLTVVMLETNAFSSGDTTADPVAAFGAVDTSAVNSNVTGTTGGVVATDGLPGASAKRVPFTPEENTEVVRAI